MINFQLSDIQNAARQFVDAMQGRTVVALYGGMGAGKTTFVKALCHALGVTDDTVASPTFAIVNEYQAPDGPIYHLDLYRLRHLSEALDLGCEDYLYSGRPCFIEWPQLIEPLLPEDTMSVTIQTESDDSRTLSIE